ncbi:MAG: short chain dehydrogenase, partial [Chloroflexota bacterium]
AAGGEAISHLGDVADLEAAEEMVRTVLDEWGRADVVVNAAGILRDRMTFNMTEEEWHAVIRVHPKGTFATTMLASLYWR